MLTTVRCSSGHQTRTEFWREKIARNRARDRKALSSLKDQGWRVLTVWVCALKGSGRCSLDDVLGRCEDFILGNTKEVETITGTRLASV